MAKINKSKMITQYEFCNKIHTGLITPQYLTKLINKGIVKKDSQARIDILDSTLNIIYSSKNMMAKKAEFLNNLVDKAGINQALINKILAELDTEDLEDNGDSDNDLIVKIQKAKLALLEAQGRIREINYKLKTGELVTVEDVTRNAEDLAQNIRGALIQLPQLLAFSLEHKSSQEIAEVLTAEFEKITNLIQKNRFFTRK